MKPARDDPASWIARAIIVIVAPEIRTRVQIDRERWLACDDPVLVLRADSPDAVRRTLVDVEHLTRDRALHAVGFLTFEASAAFGLPVGDRDPRLPYAWFALFESRTVREVGAPERVGNYELGPLTPSVDMAAFERAFARIKAHLAAGDSYQVNFTLQLQARFDGDAEALFADLTRAQRANYGAFIDLGDVAIASASPELFFAFEGLDIVTRPMKGTARRGMTVEDDRAAAAALAASPKERAENVMVVDMLRNDLGRVADVGSVTVPELFRVERYPNVWQMTSEVRARSMAPLEEVCAALFPSASITGAPKIRTMEILRELEGRPRGIYTGAIGYVPPDGLARFNVAIRTAVIDRARGELSYGVGSGVVWDSDAASEYAECLLKGSVLTSRREPFSLLETLRWTPEDGCVLLDRHIARLEATADYFDVPLDLAAVKREFEALSGGAPGLRVRLLVAQDGAVSLEQFPFVAVEGPLRVCLARTPVDAADPFLYHKTTRRAVYDQARGDAPGFDEVVLWNANGEVTEATTANVVVELNGVRVTPPVASGLLAGTYRAELLARGEVVERRITVDELSTASGLWLINSVQGMRVAELIPRA